MRTLHGKTVLVTGAARGIGEAVARLAAEKGARVALVGLEPERLASLAAALERTYAGKGGRAGRIAMWAEADVTDSDALEAAAADAAEQLDGIDVVVANAGIAGRGTVATARVEALAKVIEVNLTGVVRTVHATLPHVTARRGHYLLVSSASSFLIMPGMIDYAASKAAVEHFGTGLRLELDHTGVTVGTAHPIWIDTDMVRDARSDLPVFEQALRQMPGPLGQTISVEDCARAFVAGIERRKRKIYVPRSLAVYAGLRTLLSGRVGHRLAARAVDVPAMEAQVRALGRSYGVHAAVAPIDAPAADAEPQLDDGAPRAS